MNYYNENDKRAAAWLRELIAAKLIAPGVVDERSILDVKPEELEGYNQCHFFAGIGGWSYALRIAGWPDDKPVWTGSCPCQPFSVAGLGAGFADPRHLWPAFFRLIAERRPAKVFGEQVASSLGRAWLAGVFADLEGVGYAVAGADLCAAGVGAPHIRQRLYWVAQSGSSEVEIRASSEFGRSSSRPDIGLAHPEQPREHGGNQRGFAASGGEMGEPKNGARSPNQPGDRRETVGGLGNPVQPGLEGHAGHGDDRDEPGRDGAEPVGSVAQAGGVGGVDDTTNERARQSGTPQPCGDRPDNRVPWAASQWHLCRDGKHRRIPKQNDAKPIFQLLANGIPRILGDSWTNIIQQTKEKIESYAQEAGISASQVLQTLRKTAGEEPIQRDAGGQVGVSSPEVLLVALLQLEGELGEVAQGEIQGINQTPWAEVRDLRPDPVKPSPTPRSPQERGLVGQPPGKLHDIVYELSHSLARSGEAEAIITAAVYQFPLAGKLPGRVGLLRGAGNAIVPELAAEFIKAAT